jgi:hypothetical protein
MKNTIATTAAALVFALSPFAPEPRAQAMPPSSIFDKPLDARVVALPADKDNPQAKPKRSCFYYPDFMVKEIDLGEPGAERLSFTPIASDRKQPNCVADNQREVVIKSHEWSGYFDGMKGNFAFFDADDGHEGGMPFAVFTPAAKKLFEDIRQGDDFKSIRLTSDTLTMRYRRVYVAPCSLYADARGCWDKIVGTTALAQSARPDCTKPYEKEMKRTPKFAKDLRNAKSVIAYNVTAAYVHDKLTFAPSGGSIGCWLED